MIGLTTFTSTVHGIRVLLADERERKEAERELQISRVRASLAEHERQAAVYRIHVALLRADGKIEKAAIVAGKQEEATARARSCREILARMESANAGAKGGAL